MHYALEANKPPFYGVFEPCHVVTAAGFVDGREAVFAQKRVEEGLYRFQKLAFS